MFQREVAERIVRAARRQGLWPPRRAVRLAHRGAARFRRRPLGLHPAAEGHLAVVHLVPRPAAQRGRGRNARGGDPRRLRPAPQDDPPEPQGPASAARYPDRARRACAGTERAEELPVSAFLAMAREIEATVPARAYGVVSRRAAYARYSFSASIWACRSATKAGDTGLTAAPEPGRARMAGDVVATGLEILVDQHVVVFLPVLHLDRGHS